MTADRSVEVAADAFIAAQPDVAPPIELRGVQHSLHRLLELQGALVGARRHLAGKGVVVVSIVTDDLNNMVPEVDLVADVVAAR